MGFTWSSKDLAERAGKGTFEAQLDVMGDDENKTFTLRLWWKDSLHQSGKIFIPSEAIKWAFPRILELEKKGFKEKLESQVWPP